MADAKHSLTLLNRLAERKPENERWLREALSGRLERLGAIALEVESEGGGPIGRIFRELQQQSAGDREDSAERNKDEPVDDGSDSDNAVDKVDVIVRNMAESLCELIAQDPQALSGLEWRELERVVAVALAKIGFTVELTPPAKDGGKDVIASCIVENREKVFYVEIKHWRAGGRPSLGHILDFVEVNVMAKTDGGLFLSSSGYTESVHSRLAEISSQRVRLGQEEKIVSLCRHFVRRRHGVWASDKPLPEVLFEHTITNSMGQQVAL